LETCSEEQSDDTTGREASEANLSELIQINKLSNSPIRHFGETQSARKSLFLSS
jgi:hypothetical protein